MSSPQTANPQNNPTTGAPPAGTTTDTGSIQANMDGGIGVQGDTTGVRDNTSVGAPADNNPNTTSPTSNNPTTNPGETTNPNSTTNPSNTNNNGTSTNPQTPPPK